MTILKPFSVSFLNPARVQKISYHKFLCEVKFAIKYNLIFYTYDFSSYDPCIKSVNAYILFPMFRKLYYYVYTMYIKNNCNLKIHMNINRN